MLATILLAAVVVSAPTLAMYVAPLLSIAVAALTKVNASPRVKALVNLLLSAIVAVISTAINAGHLVISTQTLVAFAWSFALSVAAYYGLFKPTGVNAAVALRTAKFGLGRS